MENNINKINWFPGHMKKATDEIKHKITDVDLIIEILDARAINVSSNPELLKIANGKPILKVALKHDLSDISTNTGDITNLIIGSIKHLEFKKIILKKIYEILDAKIQRLKNKGVQNPQFLIMVVGIPNVGKSSFINFLAPKNSLKVQNRAGVTKNQTTRKINEYLFLIDTPGVLVKNIVSIEEGYQLAIINCINKDILPMHDVIKYCYEYLYANYCSQLSKYFNFKITDDFVCFIDSLCENYKFKLTGNEFDYDRAYETLFNLISNGHVAKIHF